MNTHATFTITVPWWAYGAFCAAVLALLAGGYAAGRLDARDDRKAKAAEAEFAPTIQRWRALDQKPDQQSRPALAKHHTPTAGGDVTAWPVNWPPANWAAALEKWGQPRQPAAYPPPPPLTPEPDPRTTPPTVGRAAVTDVAPLEWFEEISASNVALGGRVHWAADDQDTTLLTAVQA